MKLKSMIASAMLVAGTSFAGAQQLEDLTSNADTQILVKNNFGECVTVTANRNLVGCGVVEEKPVEKITEVVTQNVSLSGDAYFNFDKYDLKPEGKEAIQKLAQELNQRGAAVQSITVVGNTDSVGSDVYNQKLSERRAASVANYLVENGVPASIIQSRGDGERNPVASNSTAEGRAKNRRVDIQITGIVEEAVVTEVIEAPVQAN